MASLDGLRVWLESSKRPDGTSAKELECYTVKHIGVLKTITAYVESTVDHYFHVCFTLPNDLEDGVNVDIEIDGVLCAELYRDAKDWTHRCSGTLIEAASERPFQFKEATLVEDDDERVLKDEHIVKNAGSVKLTFRRAKRLMHKPVQDDQILKPTHDEKVYSEKDKKAMSHSVGFGEARDIPTMEFCHSEPSEPYNVSLAVFIFYYRSRALLEALGHIKAVEATSDDASHNKEENAPTTGAEKPLQTAEKEGNAQADDRDEEDLPDIETLRSSQRLTSAAPAATGQPSTSPALRKPVSTIPSSVAPGSSSTTTSASASISSAIPGSSSLPSRSSLSPPSASTHSSRPSLTPPTSRTSEGHEEDSTSISTKRGIEKGKGKEPARADEQDTVSTPKAGVSAVSTGKKRTREVKREVEEEDELPDEDNEGPPAKLKVKREGVIEREDASSSSLAPSSDASRRSETVDAMQDKIERLEAENRRLQEEVAASRAQSEGEDTKPVL